MEINWEEVVYIIIEAACNGVILAVFGKWLDKTIKRTETKEKTHDAIVNTFTEELAKLNKALIKVNSTVQFKKVSNADDIVKLLEENVLKQWIEIIAYYDTYRYDLQKFEVYYNAMEKAWMEFTQQTTAQMLGVKLQEFKEANQTLITKIRNKY